MMAVQSETAVLVGLRSRTGIAMALVALFFVTACTGADPVDTGDSDLDDNDRDVQVNDRDVAVDEETYDWTVQVYTLPGSETHDWMERWADRVRVMSRGQIQMQIHPGASLVGYPEMQEALREGILDLSFVGPAFFSGVDPAFGAWFSMPMLPFGEPESAGYLWRQWMYEYGGLELANELNEPLGIHVIGAVVVTPEPVQSNRPLRTLEDFEGLRVRAAPGLVAEMFEAVGAEVVPVGAAEVYTALDTGVIDAAEFVGVTENFGVGLHEVTDYVLWPGFHGPAGIADLTIRQETWDALPEHLQLILEDSVRWLDGKIHEHILLRDREVLEQLESEFGLEVNSLPPEDVERVMRLALEVSQEYGTRSEMAGKFVDSMIEFLRFTGHLAE